MSLRATLGLVLVLGAAACGGDGSRAQAYRPIPKEDEEPSPVEPKVYESTLADGSILEAIPLGPRPVDAGQLDGAMLDASEPDEDAGFLFSP